MPQSLQRPGRAPATIKALGPKLLIDLRIAAAALGAVSKDVDMIWTHTVRRRRREKPEACVGRIARIHRVPTQPALAADKGPLQELVVKPPGKDVGDRWLTRAGGWPVLDLASKRQPGSPSA